jgi:hypothetical protein
MMLLTFIGFGRFENTENTTCHILMIFHSFVFFQLQNEKHRLCEDREWSRTSMGIPFLNHLTGAVGSLT